MNNKTYVLSSAANRWSEAYINMNMAYPAEYAIRIFKGEYPKLNFDKTLYPQQRILDVGCGDGRNLLMLRKCGFSCYGIEITDEIAYRVRENLSGIEGIEIRTGHNACIPYNDGFFDYLLSWNGCYYMGNELNFNAHVAEYSRVIKPGGKLVLSIPKKSCFIYKDCEVRIAENGEKYAIIRKDPYAIRDGESLRLFEDENDVEENFSEYFDSFVFGSIHDDCFGYDYHWYLIVCKKKER